MILFYLLREDMYEETENGAQGNAPVDCPREVKTISVL